MIYYLKIYNLRFIYYLAIYLSPRPPLPNRGGVGGEASFLLHHYFLAILDVQTLLSLVDAAQTLFNKISGKKCTHVQEFAYICRLKTDIY